jgi:ATP-dependent DNA helicase RecQ
VSDLLLLQRAFNAWPDREKVTSLLSADHPRLASAISGSPPVGEADIATLVRDLLRTWQTQASQLELPLALTVPADAPWPTQAAWRRASVRVVPSPKANYLRIAGVDPWSPEWLLADEAADAYPAGRELRRPVDLRNGDPIWVTYTRLPDYRSLEQREAVRAVLVSPPDATILVCLPTGSGKSLVALLAALSPDVTNGVTVVVVPTVSLAIDQEERLREHLFRLGASDADGSFAFHHGLTTPARAELYKRIRNGQQRVVFTSPEAACGVLGEVLGEAADSGYIAQFVIDEAHTVASWGAEFRPDFQMLAGVRRQLLVRARRGGLTFRTILMTATATEADVETLTDLFVESGRQLVICGAAALRPELSYWAAKCADREERSERVLESVMHLPRPLFVYTSTKDDARNIFALLSDNGFHRVALVTGDSTEDERRSAVRALRGDAVQLPTADIAVGTSAFGLGIDIPDVRSVVHACLPESIDRYFQEVGRAGRDGRAAAGYLLWTRDDEDVAAYLNEEKLIGVPLARERWSAMVATSTAEDGILWVPLDALRIGLQDTSDENKRWNARTLALMAKTKLVTIVGARREDRRDFIGVRLERHDLRAASSWEEVETFRRQSRATRREQLAGVVAIANGAGVCDALRETYDVAPSSRRTAALAVDDACGGCIGCRAYGERLPAAPPLPVPPPPVQQRLSDGLGDFLQGRDFVLVTDDGSDGFDRRLARAIACLSRAGIRHVVGSRSLANSRAVVRELDALVLELGLRAPLWTEPRELVEGGVELAALPTLLLVGPEEADDPLARVLLSSRVLPRPNIAVLPAGYRSWERRDMTVREMYPASLRVADLPEEVAC